MTFVALFGPLFTAVIVYESVAPRTTLDGPVFVTAISLVTLGQVTVVVAVLELFVLTGSGLEPVTVTVFVAVVCVQLARVVRLNTSDSCVLCGPGPKPSEPVQTTFAPCKEQFALLPVGTNVIPEGTGSVTVYVVGFAEVPLFVTVREYVIFWPRIAVAGPVFTIARSESLLGHVTGV